MEVQNLKAYLANVGMTIREFSEKVDCSPRYLARLSSGELIPSKRLARDINQATNGIVKLKTKAENCKKSQGKNDEHQN